MFVNTYPISTKHQQKNHIIVFQDVRIPTTQNEEMSVSTQASQVKPRKFLP